MSKGKNPVNEKKKTADPAAKKAPSAYQTGKTTVSQIDISPLKKKKV